MIIRLTQEDSPKKIPFTCDGGLGPLLWHSELHLILVLPAQTLLVAKESITPNYINYRLAIGVLSISKWSQAVNIRKCDRYLGSPVITTATTCTSSWAQRKNSEALWKHLQSYTLTGFLPGATLWWSRNHEARSVQIVPCELPSGLFSKFTPFI